MSSLGPRLGRGALGGSIHDRRGALAPDQATEDPPPVAARRWRGTPVLPAVVAVASAGFFVVGSGTGVDPVASARYLGIAVLSLSVVPLLARFAARRHGAQVRPVPFLEIASILHGIYFGLPGVVQSSLNPIGDMVASVDRLTALSLSWIALLALLLGVFVGGSLLPKWRLRPIALPSATLPEGIPGAVWEGSPARAARTVSCAGCLLAFGLVLDIARTRGVGAGLGQIVPLLGQMTEVGLGILLVLMLRGHVARGPRIVWILGASVYLILRIGEGSVAQAVFPAVALCLTTWGVGRRIPLWSLVCAVLLVVILRANAETFRSESWTDGAAGEASLEMSERFLEIAKENAASSGLGGAIDLVLARLNQSATLGFVIGETPTRVPYWGGESYRTLFSSLIPRVIWPDKPTKLVGQEFGHRYEILHPSDETTSINLPLLVEMYANFGRNGALFGMVLLGVFYRWLMDLVNRRELGYGMVVVSAIVMSRMLNIESDFSLTFGALPFQVIVLLMVTRWAFGDDALSARAASAGGAGERATGSGGSVRRGAAR